MPKIKPNIQDYFDYKYVEGELHIYVRKELVDELGWDEKDLELSFGGIRHMNSWGKDAYLSIHKVKDKTHYERPWYEYTEKDIGLTD